MKNFLLSLLLLVSVHVLADGPVIQTTPFTRNVLRAPDAGTVRSDIGVSTTAASATNQTLWTPTFNGGTGNSVTNNGPVNLNPTNTGGIYTFGMFTNPAVTGGTFTGSTNVNSISTNPVVSGGTFTGSTNVNVISTNPVVSGGTFTGSTNVNVISTNPVVSGGTFTGSTNVNIISTNPAVTGGSFTSGNFVGPLLSGTPMGTGNRLIDILNYGDFQLPITNDYRWVDLPQGIHPWKKPHLGLDDWITSDGPEWERPTYQWLLTNGTMDVWRSLGAKPVWVFDEGWFAPNGLGPVTISNGLVYPNQYWATNFSNLSAFANELRTNGFDIGIYVNFSPGYMGSNWDANVSNVIYWIKPDYIKCEGWLGGGTNVNGYFSPQQYQWFQEQGIADAALDSPYKPIYWCVSSADWNKPWMAEEADESQVNGNTPLPMQDSNQDMTNMFPVYVANLLQSQWDLQGSALTASGFFTENLYFFPPYYSDDSYPTFPVNQGYNTARTGIGLAAIQRSPITLSGNLYPPFNQLAVPGPRNNFRVPFAVFTNFYALQIDQDDGLTPGYPIWNNGDFEVVTNYTNLAVYTTNWGGTLLQKPPGAQISEPFTNWMNEIWFRPLANNQSAVGLKNSYLYPTNINLTASEAGTSSNGVFSLFDSWPGQLYGWYTNSVSIPVKSYDFRLFRVYPGQQQIYMPGVNWITLDPINDYWTNAWPVAPYYPGPNIYGPTNYSDEPIVQHYNDGTASGWSGGTDTSNFIYVVPFCSLSYPIAGATNFSATFGEWWNAVAGHTNGVSIYQDNDLLTNFTIISGGTLAQSTNRISLPISGSRLTITVNDSGPHTIQAGNADPVLIAWPSMTK